MYRLKIGVAILMTEELEKILSIIEKVFYAFKLPVVITSGLDGPHRENSLHGKFRALDFRSDFPDAGHSIVWRMQFKYIIECLRDQYREAGYPVNVILEEDHLHIEWDGA